MEFTDWIFLNYKQTSWLYVCRNTRKVYSYQSLIKKYNNELITKAKTECTK